MLICHASMQARVEALGQALLRRTQEGATTPLGLVHMRGRRAVVAADAYEEHFLLPDDLVVMLTNRRSGPLAACSSLLSQMSACSSLRHACCSTCLLPHMEHQQTAAACVIVLQEQTLNHANGAQAPVHQGARLCAVAQAERREQRPSATQISARGRPAVGSGVAGAPCLHLHFAS